MSLHFIVKSRCSKFLPNTGFVTIRLLRFGVKVKRAYTVATICLLRGHCQICAGCPETIFIARHYTDARYWYSKSVRPSVRYQHQTFSQNSDGASPCGGAKYRWGRKISRLSTNKSLYLTNDTRYRHSYYGRQIGTRLRSIKWCHFQWRWTNANPVFNVTPLFDTKYLTNSYRYGHSYYRRRIGNCTQAFEWHRFQLPWSIDL